MNFIEWFDDEGLEPDLALMTAIVGREEAERKLEAWRMWSLERRAIPQERSE